MNQANTMQSPFRLVVLNDFASANGGASSLAIANANLMASTGVDVTYLCGERCATDGPLHARVSRQGLNGAALDPARPLNNAISGLYNPATQRFLADWIGAHDTPHTVYHLHGWSKIFSPSVFKALAQVASRTLVHAHDYFPACPNGAFINYPQMKECDLLPSQMGCLFSNCDQRNYPQKLWRLARHEIKNRWFDLKDSAFRIVLPHEAMRPYFTRSGCMDDTVFTVPNPVVPFTDTRIRAETNDEFLFIGRLVPEKGVDTFLAAARHARVKAKVIGAGPLLGPLKAQYPEVEFTGWQDRDTIGTHLRNARAVIMPSKLRETFGLVAIESIASGIPVVVSTSSAVASDLVRMNAGLTVAPDDVAALAPVMTRLAGSDELVRTMSDNGHAHWRQVANTTDSWADSLRSMYGALAAGAGAGHLERVH